MMSELKSSLWAFRGLSDEESDEKDPGAMPEEPKEPSEVEEVGGEEEEGL